jgi:restriction endonuclease S subunit
MFYLLQGQQDTVREGSGGSTFEAINRSQIEEITIPFPPLDKQERIVAELDGYRKIIEGARQVIANYKPTIKIDPTWQRVRLGDVCYINAPLVDPKDEKYCSLPHVSAEDIEPETGLLLPVQTASEDRMTSGKYLFDAGCVLYSKLRPYLRKAVLATFRGLCSADMYPISTNQDRLIPEFLVSLLLSKDFTEYADNESRRARMPKLNRDQLYSFETGIPPISVQQQIVQAMQSERALVDTNRKLIEIFKAKIKAKLDEIWRE